MIGFSVKLHALKQVDQLWDVAHCAQVFVGISPIKGYRCFPFTVAVEIDSNNYQSNKLHSGLVRFCRVA